MNKTSAKKEAEKWLDKLDLSDYKNNKIDDLSNGCLNVINNQLSQVRG